MSTTAVAAPSAAAPAAVKARSSKRPSAKKAEHPTYREMISSALGAMKERKGTSRQKIQKYIADTYKIDLSASNSHLKRALTSGVTKGAFLQTTGKGASGSFKLAPMPAAGPKKRTKKVAKKPAVKKAAAKKSAKKCAPKKAAKKPAAKKRPAKKTATKKAACKKKKVTKRKPAAKKASKKASTKKSCKK